VSDLLAFVFSACRPARRLLPGACRLLPAACRLPQESGVTGSSSRRSGPQFVPVVARVRSRDVSQQFSGDANTTPSGKLDLDHRRCLA
jgi:hypothetical protein